MSQHNADFRASLRRMPVIAILRGIRADEVAEVSDALVDNGIEILEIPLNSPDPLRSIELLAELRGDRCRIGCGTVLTEQQLRDAHAAGASLVLHPHGDARLVALAKQLGMISVPGITSPTEAFAMLRAGADALKCFPTSIVSPATLAAMKEVLPTETLTIAVGGVSEDNMREFWNAGVDAFGVGGRLYRAGWGADQVRHAAARLATLARELLDTGRGEQ